MSSRKSGNLQSSCRFCGKSFIAKGTNPGVYCSIACKAAWQRLQKPVTREWLYQKYVVENMSCSQIAKIVKRNPKQVWEWLVNEGIATRKRGEVDNGHRFITGATSAFAGKRHTDETKKMLREIAISDGRVPFDPKVGPPFKGKRGADTPNWKGGVTSERQAFYSTVEWKAAVKAVWLRTNGVCERCGKKNKKGVRYAFDIHHIVSFACVELRSEQTNLALLCETCHYWVHSLENKDSEFIRNIP